MTLYSYLKGELGNEYKNWAIDKMVRGKNFVVEVVPFPGLSNLYSSDIRIIKDYGNIIEIYYKDKLIQRYIIAGKSSDFHFVCPPIPPTASDRLRRCGLFAQFSLITA